MRNAKTRSRARGNPPPAAVTPSAAPVPVPGRPTKPTTAQCLQAGQRFLENLSGSDGPAVAYLGRLQLALPGIDTDVVMEAILRLWDITSAEDKLSHLAEAGI